jgi:hypothetical protein
MSGEDMAAAHPLGLFTLDVLLQTDDDELARRIATACRRRGHRLVRVSSLRDLPRASAHRPSAVLLLDTRASVETSAHIAESVRAACGHVPVAIAADGRPSRSAGGFRVVDRGWAGARVLDELELAYIGIPASIDEAWAGGRHRA